MKRRAKSLLRRFGEAWLPSEETLRYRRWLLSEHNRLAQEDSGKIPGGLFTLLTPVWEGSPLRFLRRLAQSVMTQNRSGAIEWILLDNGCQRQALKSFLQQTSELPGVSLISEEQNIGIARGLRRCLETARNQYILPVDADDELQPSALTQAAHFVEAYDYPDALYSDEDKLVFQQGSQPYFKPDYDPVLLVNSAYTAHLQLVKRSAALAVGAYSETGVEGSADWDVFLQLAAKAYRIEHIPAMLYRWRTHRTSTADSGNAKNYVAESQRTALQRYLAARNFAYDFIVEPSPLFIGDAHFRLRFLNTESQVPTISLPGSLYDLQTAVRSRAGAPFVALIDQSVRASDTHWLSEAEGWCRMFPDTVMVGGLLRDAVGRVQFADEQLGFQGFCASPHKGRLPGDPGYFGQLFKVRSTGAASSMMAVVKTDFLLSVLHHIPTCATPEFLGAWIGAEARRTSGRVVYSPFIAGWIDSDLPPESSGRERESFRNRYRDLLPDRRFYPKPFSMGRGFSIEP